MDSNKQGVVVCLHHACSCGTRRWWTTKGRKTREAQGLGCHFLLSRWKDLQRGRYCSCLFLPFSCFFSHFSFQPSETDLDSIFSSPCISNTKIKGNSNLIPTPLCFLSRSILGFIALTKHSLSVNAHESRTETAGCI